MKKILILVMVCCLFTTYSSYAANNGTGIYIAPKFIYGVEMSKPAVRVNGHTQSLGSHNKWAPGGALALGYDFYRKFELPLRLELEYGAMANTKHKGMIGSVHTKTNLSSKALFANAYYDFHNDSPFTPYVGGGLGLGFVNTKGHLANGSGNLAIPGRSRNNFAWNLGLGCAYNFTDNIALDLGYRYASLGKADSKTMLVHDMAPISISGGKRVGIHQALLALRVTF